MANLCKACRHPQLRQINEALIAGGPLREITSRWSVSKSALLRHKTAHLPATLVKAREAAEIVEADALMEKIKGLEEEARRIGKLAETAGDLRAALGGIRELVRITELMAKLTGRLDVDKRGGDLHNHAHVHIHYPQMTDAENAIAVAAQEADMPPAARRLLQRPSDGAQR